MSLGAPPLIRRWRISVYIRHPTAFGVDAGAAIDDGLLFHVSRAVGGDAVEVIYVGGLTDIGCRAGGDAGLPQRV